ncbi:MAG: response regulator [Candidatus Methylomirabilales bacterium]
MKAEGSLRRRILVVEDDEDMRENLRRIFLAAGYEVSLAEDGPEAMTVLRTQPCHLVLTDLVMPGMNGLELLRKIRQEDQDLPVVVLTAFGDRATFAKATELGAVDFVTKPFRAGSLLGLIHRTLGSQSKK